MQQLTHTPTENTITNIHGNQQNIYNINMKRQEVNRWMLIESTLKGKLISQHKTIKPWLVKTIKAIMKAPIKKLEIPFSHSGEHMRQQ